MSERLISIVILRFIVLRGRYFGCGIRGTSNFEETSDLGLWQYFINYLWRRLWILAVSLCGRLFLDPVDQTMRKWRIFLVIFEEILRELFGVDSNRSNSNSLMLFKSRLALKLQRLSGMSFVS